MAPERSFEKSGKQEQISSAEQKVFDFLVPKYQKSAIKIEDFSDLYGDDVITNDLMYVAQVQANIEKRPYTKRALILEALLNEQIELSDWFGPEAHTITPSDFDDFRNGVDIVIEFEEDGGFKQLALGVDVASSANHLTDKLAQIKKRILNGRLTVMKYFKSERSNIRKELRGIPNLVIGASGEVIRDLSDLWLAANSSKFRRDKDLSPESIDNQKKRAKESHRQLADHRTKALILREMKMQLEVFIPFALKNKQEEVAEKFSKLLQVVNELLKEVKLSDEDELKNEQDYFFVSLAEQLRSFEDIVIPS